MVSGAPASAPIRASSRLSVSSWRTRRRAPGAEREPDAEFLLPRGGARQQQIGDIGANDQQHQAAHRHEDAQRAPAAGTGRRKCAFQMGTSGPPRRRWYRDAVWPTVAASAEISAFACCKVTPGLRRARPSRLRVWRSRNIQSGMVLSCEAITSGTQISKARPGMLPRNSGGATPMMVSCCRFTLMLVPSTARVGVEAALPESVADDGYRITARLVAMLFGGEESAGGGANAQERK